MLFASIIFVFFFLPLMVATYYARPSTQYKNILLLGGSVFFYFWGEAWNIFTLLSTVIINYFLALWVDRADGKSRKFRLGLGIAINLSILIYYKYTGFFSETYNSLAHLLHLKPLEVANRALPLGISFFVFHAISYLIDTHRGSVRSEKKFSDLALYFFLFPHQIAGPVVRYELFAGQVNDRAVPLSDLIVGIERFIIGLSKKVLIANSVAVGADYVFGLKPDAISSAMAWFGALCYTLQIYFDFSGYSDMAIGLARIFGFRFHENFNFPYRATTVTDFWRRWHISLSSWFRDYLYIPLGGNRVSKSRTYVNLALVFFLCGLWHGANWTFVAWGLWHGLFLIIERFGIEKRLKKHVFIGSLWTLVIAIVGWVLFRAENLNFAFKFIKKMVIFTPTIGESFFHFQMIKQNHLIFVGILTGVLLSSGHLGEAVKKFSTAGAKFDLIYKLGLLSLFLLSMSKLADGTFNPFIYFRF